MKILLTGGSGFVGQRLCTHLHESGHSLLVVSRSPARAQALLPPSAEVRPSALDFLDQRPEAIINLAGESIAGKRWSPQQKQRLIHSRLEATQGVVDLCSRLDPPPQTLISASAMGYYGDQGEAEVDEQTAPHPEFVHDLCAQWEAAALAAESYGVRVALVRIGLVLDRDGGTLAKLLPVFKLGLGGKLGSGRQYMPWIHRDDLVRLILFLLEHPEHSGPFNASAPQPVTNAEFTRILARQLGRPALFPAPAPLLRLLLGELSRVMLTGARMVPRRALDAGFRFDYPQLDSALAAILRR